MSGKVLTYQQKGHAKSAKKRKQKVLTNFKEIFTSRNMFNILCSTYVGKGSSYLLSLVYLTIKSGSLVVEQWARYPEVAGSIPTHTQPVDNSQISQE